MDPVVDPRMIPEFQFRRTGPFGPSDAAIQSYIDRHLDPEGAHRSDHWFWRHQLLSGRDNFHGLFVRHDPSVSQPQSLHKRPALMLDPPSYTEERRSQTYVDFTPVGHDRDHRDAVRDIHGLFLHPCVRTGPSSDVHLLSTEMCEERVAPWAPDCLSITGDLIWAPGQVEWTRYVLTHMRDILESTEIFGGVAMTLFSFLRHDILIKAMATNWSYVWNTFPLEDREATLDIQQMVHLLGVPAEGHIYEERVPPDEELSGIDPSGLEFHSPSARVLFQIYYEIAATRALKGQSRDVPFRAWIRYFMDRVPEGRASPFVDPLDPMGVGSDQIHNPHIDRDFSRLSSRVLDRVTVLAAYLSWWLCYYVLPYDPAGYIRPGVFVMAATLARGFRVSLAVPALVNVYRAMRELTSSRDPSYARVVMPSHILLGWFYICWERGYSPAISSKLREQLPALSFIAGAPLCDVKAYAAHMYFIHSVSFISCYRPEAFTRDWPGDREDLTRLVDSEVSARGARPCLCSRRFRHARDFAIATRAGFLTTRIGDRVIAEVYSPHRCAWQFGYDQDIPATIVPSRPPIGTFESIAEWGIFALRLGTGAEWFIPSVSRIGVMTSLYDRWLRRWIKFAHTLPPAVLKSKVFPTHRTSRQRSRLGSRQLRSYSGVDTRVPSLHPQPEYLAPPKLLEDGTFQGVSIFFSNIVMYVIISISFFYEFV
ncbi:Plant mobile domain protein family [Rhynchospora pubera]|uniref:Plant mobile domain protein family n=1 Tax=Rhynchospora pubera TaxID=906938 RepID=A0AAV8HEL9_9POAL|nr:Plant mobile domain protein family [Rhynchospora pubera]